jgi:carbon monoxide dehydrogenase subunit G
LKLSNTFDVPIAIDEAWRLLLDIERIAPCMPGAELVEAVDRDTYKGRVSVRLGPVMLAFEGTARFLEIDEGGHRARVEAKGTDKKGRGGANAVVTFQLQPRGAATAVLIDTDLQLSGSVAQYGRASGVIAEVASQLTRQFAESLSAKIASDGASAAPESGSGHGATLARQPAPAAAPISGFSLAWGVLRATVARLLRRLFGRD